MGAEMTDKTEREALTDAIIGRYPSFDPLSANGIADAILAAGFHRTPTQHVEADGPEHGHTFEVSIRSRGSSTVIGSGVYRDANWWSQPMTVRVRAWDGPAALRAAAEVPLGEWDMPDEDTSEPPADDGYVSRNVYDYDECQSCNWKPTLGDSVLSRHIALSHPEPPTGLVVSEDGSLFNWHGENYVRQSTPSPHIVTTVEELRDLPDATIVKAHGYSRVAQKLLGAWYFPGALDAVTFEARMLPATVLTPAPALPDVIHLTDFRNPSTTAMCGEPTTVITERGDTRPVCQTCHRGAMKSAQAGTPIDREALDEVALNAIMSERYFAGHPAENTMAQELSGVVTREVLAALASLGYVRIDPTDEALVARCAKAIEVLDESSLNMSWVSAARAVLATIEGVRRG